MRVLWVKADKLLPVENGGNIRSYHVLRYLVSRQELTFYSYYGGKPDPDHERELLRQLPGAVAVCTGKKDLAGIAGGLDYVAHLGAQAPYAVGYEAMATAKAVVSTTVGAEGLDVHHERDIVILADDARAFSQAVIILLRDRDLRRRYENAAAETRKRYGWPAIGEQFSEVLQSMVDKNAHAAGAVPAGWA